MAFDEQDWMDRMDNVKTDEELTALVMELPQRELHEMSEEERESFIMEQKIESEFLTYITRTAKTRGG
jgi:hypothetical protein